MFNYKRTIKIQKYLLRYNFESKHFFKEILNCPKAVKANVAQENIHTIHHMHNDYHVLFCAKTGTNKGFDEAIQRH